jgi:hypothetical protein
MKKRFIFIILVLGIVFSNTSFSQKPAGEVTPPKLFDKDFNAIHPKGNTFEQMLNSLTNDPVVREYIYMYTNDDAVIFFYPLTSTPILIWADSKDKAIKGHKSFCQKKYLFSNEIESVMDKAISNLKTGKVPLTDVFFIQNMPQKPSSTNVKNINGVIYRTLFYDPYGLTVIFKNGFLSSYSKN